MRKDTIREDSRYVLMWTSFLIYIFSVLLFKAYDGQFGFAFFSSSSVASSSSFFSSPTASGVVSTAKKMPILLFDDADTDKIPCVLSPSPSSSRSTRVQDDVRTKGTYFDQAIHVAIVADLDKKSRHPTKFEWHSFLKLGTLRRKHPADNFTVEWSSTKLLTSTTATKNRSMELSALVNFEGKFFAFCDYTGSIMRIREGRVFPRQNIVSGDGKTTSMPFKTEWATIKDGRIVLGSNGKEWVSDNGTVLHRHLEWVKTIDARGRIRNHYWGPIYQQLRTLTNCSFPGYLWHEAITWDDRSRQWIILPRKVSRGIPYDPLTDERLGANMVIVADEYFRNVSVLELPRADVEVPGEWGFTSVRKILGTVDTYAALRVREIGDSTRTTICIFDLSGRYYTDPPFVDVGPLKYEGLAIYTG